MGKDIIGLFKRNSYPFSIFLAIIYYAFFTNEPTPGFWEKILIILAGVTIIIFYGLANFSTDKRFVMDFMKEGVLRTLVISLFIVFVTAVAQYFVLSIFFWKNPPVSVGIPYSIYSFSAGKLILSGFLYNCVFFVATNIFINKIKSKF